MQIQRHASRPALDETDVKLQNVHLITFTRAFRLPARVIRGAGQHHAACTNRDVVTNGNVANDLHSPQLDVVADDRAGAEGSRPQLPMSDRMTNSEIIPGDHEDLLMTTA